MAIRWGEQFTLCPECRALPFCRDWYPRAPSRAADRASLVTKPVTKWQAMPAIASSAARPHGPVTPGSIWRRRVHHAAVKGRPDCEWEVVETLRLDAGCLMAMGPTVHSHVQFAGGLKNAFFGGEGVFWATVRGPGPVWLPPFPFSGFADRMAAAIRSAGNPRKGEGSALGGLGEMDVGN